MLFLREECDGWNGGAISEFYFLLSIEFCTWRIKSATTGMKSRRRSVPIKSESTKLAPMTVPSPHMIPPTKFLVMIFLQFTCSFALYRSAFIHRAYDFLCRDSIVGLHKMFIYRIWSLTLSEVREYDWVAKKFTNTPPKKAISKTAN